MTRPGIEPCTLELMDRVTIAAVDDWHNLGLDRSAAALLLVESDRPGSAATEELERAAGACTDAGATQVVRATDPAEADWLRQVRRMAFRALERLGVARMEDVGAPRSRLPDLLREIERIAASHDVRCGTFGHAGDGNLHPTFVWDRGDTAAEERAHASLRGALSRRDRSRRDGDRRARHRRRATAIPRGAGRCGGGGGHAGNQGRARPTRHPQPRQGRLSVSPGCSPRDRRSA